MARLTAVAQGLQLSKASRKVVFYAKRRRFMGMDGVWDIESLVM